MRLYLADGSFFNTKEPIDLSLQLSNTDDNPKAWYVDTPRFEPVRTDSYIGSVKEGGSVNFRDVFFNPHGHGTHTECLGHITPQVYSINDTLNDYFFKAQVLSITPRKIVQSDGSVDEVIFKDQLLIKDGIEALVIRTPNFERKKSMNYSNTNPIYFDKDCVDELNAKTIKHFLVDLPSVDKENDDGVLAFHHKFWGVPSKPDFQRTITELIYVNESVLDGVYVLNLQLAAFNNDAAPSRPVLYKIKED